MPVVAQMSDVTHGPLVFSLKYGLSNVFYYTHT